jgi:hypothetical protein
MATTPTVDPVLPTHGRTRAGPVCPHLGQPAAQLGRVSTSSAPTRRPPSRPAAAATPLWLPARPARCGSTTPTGVAEPRLPGRLRRPPRESPGINPLGCFVSYDCSRRCATTATFPAVRCKVSRVSTTLLSGAARGMPPGNLVRVVTAAGSCAFVTSSGCFDRSSPFTGRLFVFSQSR